MRIHLGLSLDGYRPLGKRRHLGDIVTGPEGLLGLLETRLGLSGKLASPALRTAQYLNILRELDDGRKFYSLSLRADAFAVAETLLDWRDSWRLAGWNGLATACDRLVAMADAEALACGKLSPGPAERLTAVRDALVGRRVGIARISLYDPIRVFPKLWRDILIGLGAQADTAAIPQPADPESDLARLRSALENGGNGTGPIQLRSDGSFTVIRGEPAQSVRRVLAAHLARASGGKLLIAAAGRGCLDDAFEVCDASRTGTQRVSPWRPPLQVLPMALDLFWEPLDPQRLLEFLAHSVSPLPRRLRIPLAETVAASPGVGGRKWRSRVAELRAAYLADPHGNDSDPDRTFDAWIGDWVEFPRHDPLTGAPTARLAEHCRRIGDWAAKQTGRASLSEGEQALHRAAQIQSHELADMLETLDLGGQTLIGRVQLQRLLEHATRRGASHQAGPAELGGVPVIADSATAIEAVDEIVWADFTAEPLPAPWPWTLAEQAELRRQGAEWVAIPDQLDHRAEAWLRPLRMARRKLVLVLPPPGDDGPGHHPLWEAIAAKVDNASLPVLAPEQL